MSRYYKNMKVKTRAPHSRETILKLINGYFELAAREGVYEHIPDMHSNWYMISGITKKTFNNTIRTYDNFRQTAKKYLLEDLKGYLLNQPEVETEEDYINRIMRFMMVTAGGGERRKRQTEYQQEMRFAVYALSSEDWMEIMQPALDRLSQKATLTADERMLRGLYYRWAATVKETLGQWLEEDLQEERLYYYKKVILYYLNKIPDEAHALKLIKVTEEQSRLEKSRKAEKSFNKLPEDSWYRKVKEKQMV